MSAEGNLSEKEIRGLILSWRIMDAVELALRDIRVLRILLSLLRDGDETTRTRAFMALNEVVKRGDERVRFTVAAEGFDAILEGLSSGDSKVAMKAVRVLKNLVEGFPLSDEALLRLVRTIVSLVKKYSDDVLSGELSDVVAHLKVLHPSPMLRSEISKLISSRNPRIRAMGLRLLLNVFVFTGDVKTLKLLLDSIQDLLSEKDPLLLDFILGILMDVFGRPIPAEIIRDLPPLLDRVKSLATGSEDFFVKSKAREVAHAIEDFLYSYYSSRPEEAREVIHELIVRGEVNAAVDLAVATADEFILKWLGNVLKARGVQMDVPARMIPGPVRTPQKRKMVFMSPPLTQLAPPRKTRIRMKETVLGGNDEIPPAERTVNVLKAVEEGDAEALLAALRSGPSSIEEVKALLRNPRTRADTLWTLQAVSSRVKGEDALVLEPLVDELVGLLLNGTSWGSSKAARILAVVSAEGGRRGIAERILGFMESHPVAAFQFFSYYLLRDCDPEIARTVVDFAGKSLPSRELQFDALLVLEAVSIKCPELIWGDIISKLEEVAASAEEENSKIARRILDRLGR